MKRPLLIGFILILFLSGCEMQSGTSRDTVQGWDKGIIWNHAYLKNDHLTVYCFDKPEFIPILDEAQKTQKEVVVTYQKYLLGRGFLCEASEQYERVVMENVEIAK